MVSNETSEKQSCNASKSFTLFAHVHHIGRITSKSTALSVEESGPDLLQIEFDQHIMQFIEETMSDDVDHQQLSCG